MARKSSNRFAPIVALLAGVLICSAGLVFAQQSRGPTTAHTKVVEANFRAAKTIGSASAPITLEDFSDYQCPSCRYFFLNTTLQVIKDYADTGKVRIVHHDFPLEMHAHSMEAARYANAAAEIGKFKEVETALYSTQEKWENTGRIADSLSTVLTPAELNKVQSLMVKPDVQAAIDEDLALGKQRGITQTPSIFVTYKGDLRPLPPGGVTYGVLKQYFDYLLSH
ncbi:MAG TPA: thioredoxin domain-containing protein [Candidatus Acidoferrum sp.]|nr:thioredoxin domain-containing protein [Candidatus Acidoferrum sp.]